MQLRQISASQARRLSPLCLPCAAVWLADTIGGIPRCVSPFVSATMERGNGGTMDLVNRTDAHSLWPCAHSDRSARLSLSHGLRTRRQRKTHHQKSDKRTAAAVSDTREECSERVSPGPSPLLLFVLLCQILHNGATAAPAIAATEAAATMSTATSVAAAVGVDDDTAEAVTVSAAAAVVIVMAESAPTLVSTAEPRVTNPSNARSPSPSAGEARDVREESATAAMASARTPASTADSTATNRSSVRSRRRSDDRVEVDATGLSERRGRSARKSGRRKRVLAVQPRQQRAVKRLRSVAETVDPSEASDASIVAIAAIAMEQASATAIVLSALSAALGVIAAIAATAVNAVAAIVVIVASVLLASRWTLSWIS